MVDLSNIESRIEAIEKRNKKVEEDKSWEDSWTRKVFIAIFYLSFHCSLF